MAKTTDTNIRWFGSQHNHWQMKLGVPAGPASNKGGLIYLERENAGTVDAGGWLHTDGTDLLWTAGGTAPSDTNTGTSLGGATTTLSNIASVAIPAAGDLLPATSETVTLGDATHWFSDLYTHGDIHLMEVAAGDKDYTITFEAPAADRTLSVPDPLAAADIMLDAGATDNAISYTKGTASITLAEGNTDIIIGAAGQLQIGTGTVKFNGAAAMDVATDKVVNIDQNLTVDTTAVTLDQDMQITADVEFNSITDGTATIGASGAVSGVTTLGTTDHISIVGDSKKLYLGAGSPSDSYVEHVAAGDMTFHDAIAGTYTLSQLVAGTPLNPIVTGDFTISDGQFDWTNTAAADINTWTFANAGNDVFDIVADSLDGGILWDVNAAALTTGGILDINMGTAVTSGYGIKITSNSANTGAHKLIDLIQTHGSAAGSTVIAIDQDGDGDSIYIDSEATSDEVIDIDAAITTGIVLDIDMGTAATSGKGIKIYDNSSDVTARNLLEIVSDNTAALTGKAIYIDQDGTATAQAIHIDSESDTVTSGIVDIDAEALTTGTVLDINMGTTPTTGKGIYILSNSADVGAHSLIDLVQDNANAGSKCLTIRQDGLEEAVFVDHDNDCGVATPVLANPGAVCIDADGNDGTNAVCALYVEATNAGGGDAYGIYIDDIVAAGVPYAIVTKGTGKCSFNIETDDANFTIASTTNAEMFALDAGTDTIGINGLVSAYEFGINVTDNKSMGGIGMVQNDATGDTTGINIQMAGAGHAGTAISIDHNGTAGGIGIAIDMENVSGTCIDINGPVLTTGNVFVCNDADALTTGGFLDLKSNSTSTSSRILAQIVNDNVAAIGADCLYIQQDANSGAYAIEIDRNSSDGSTQWAVKIDSDNGGGGVGGGIDFASMGQAEPVFKFVADATDPTGGGGAATGRIAIDIAGAIEYLAYW